MSLSKEQKKKLRDLKRAWNIATGDPIAKVVLHSLRLEGDLTEGQLGERLVERLSVSAGQARLYMREGDKKKKPWKEVEDIEYAWFATVLLALQAIGAIERKGGFWSYVTPEWCLTGSNFKDLQPRHLGEAEMLSLERLRDKKNKHGDIIRHGHESEVLRLRDTKGAA